MSKGKKLTSQQPSWSHVGDFSESSPTQRRRWGLLRLLLCVLLGTEGADEGWVENKVMVIQIAHLLPPVRITLIV